MRVLITDDDRVSRQLLYTLLSRWGYEPVAAANGEEAWEVMQLPEHPSLLILWTG